MHLPARKLFACSVLTLAGLAAGCASSVTAADEGWRLMELRDYHLALDAFDQALLDEESAEVQAGRAQALYSLDQLREAETAYLRALGLNPREARWSLGLAIVQMALGDLEAAILSCDQAIGLDPGLARAYFARGYARQSWQQPDQAIADFSEAIRIDPRYAEAYNSRGILLAGQGALEAGLRDFRAALRLAPDLASAHGNAAAANYAKGEVEQALVDLNSAIKIQRRNPLFLKNRGIIYLDLGRREAAVRDFEKALSLTPDDHRLWELLSRAND